MKKIILLLIALIVLVFIIQNINTVEVHFLIWKISISMSIIIFVSILIGYILRFLQSLIKKLNSKNNI